MDKTERERYFELRRRAFDLLDVLSTHTEPLNTYVFFRGQADESWPLIPKVGRTNCVTDKRQGLGIFSVWNQFADAYEKLPENEWERLAIAQHYGLATRFLDWTYNPLVALYFASCSELSKNGKVFTYTSSNFVESSHAKLDSNWINFAPIYIPCPINNRILNQGGVFSYHANPTIPLDELIKNNPEANKASSIWSITIPSELKPIILTILNTFCINEAFIYPGLDGFSRHINWTRRADKRKY